MVIKARSLARRIVVQSLYQIGLVGAAPQDALGFVLEQEEEAVSSGARAFAKELLDGIVPRLEDIDSVLSRHLVGWTLERLGQVEKAVLRLGTFELMRDADVPTPVVLAEAVGVARELIGDESGRVVNAVLDQVALAVRGAGARDAVGGGARSPLPAE